MNLRRMMLMAPPNDGKGGAGSKTPEEIEAEEVALEERIGKAVDARLNRAISGHLTRMQPKLAADIGAQVLAGLKAQQEEGGGGDPGDEAGKPPKLAKGQSAEADQRFKALEKQLADEKKRRETSEAKQAEAEQRRARAEEDDAVKSALMAAGVKDEARIRAALHTHRGEGRIKRDDAGTILFVKRSDAGEEEVTLAKGIAEWSKTDEGKVFLPPTGASGSGGGPPKNGGANGAPGKLSTSDFQSAIFNAVTDAAQK